jgi:hypothetical protein
MNMWKGFLLGTASMFAVAGAQAADLPVKAKPVEYVKICTLYGEGFYYIPGSDTCIRLGGYVRADYYWHGQGNGGVPFYTGANGHFTRETAEYNTRHRANVFLDTRTQTAYGVLRTFESIHLQNESGAFTFTLARGFIQWAGFTFGHSQSFTDIFTLDSYQFGTPQIGGSTDGDGINLAAYTVQFGDGFSFTGEVEERRKGGVSAKPTTNLSLASALTVGSTAADNSNGQRFPDFGGVLRYDQKWGNVGVFAMGHDASASYYSCTAILTTCGHPDDQLGWAAGIGGTINLPMIAAGDRVGAQFVYTNGAAGYAGLKHGSAGMFGSGNEVAVGWITDGVYINGSNIELTTAWSVVAAYDHSWTPQLKTSLYGAYLRVEHNDTAKAFFAANVCTGAGQTNFKTVTNCDPDYAHFYAGIRTQWSPARDFLLGVDVTYTRIDTGFGGTATLAGIATRPSGVYVLDDQNDVTVAVRAQRNF